MCILDLHSVLFTRFQLDLKFCFLTTLNIIFTWSINIYRISKDMGYGWLYRISFHIPHFFFIFYFSYKNFISRELIPLYVLLWLLQWCITNNSSCQGNLPSCSKCWSMQRDLLNHIFSIHTVFSARVIWHTPSVISIKITKVNKNKTHSSSPYKKIYSWLPWEEPLPPTATRCLSGYTSWELRKIKSGKFPVTKTKTVTDT